MKIKLILENSMVFEGNSFGYEQEAIGEVVFNTSMNGYQEIITDPASYGQILVMTYPLVGNYGINLDDSESKLPIIKALVVKEKCSFPNNFRCELDLDDYLKSHKIVGIEGIDTRALAKILRKEGQMKGIIVPENNADAQSSISQRFAAFEAEKNPATQEVSTSKTYTLGHGPLKASVLDLGASSSLLKNLVDHNCTVTVYPYQTKATELLENEPDFIVLSNGPEDIQNLDEVIHEIKSLATNKPVLGVGIGHELLALAFGGRIEKHLYGHRGKQPVKDLQSKKVYSTRQNHASHVHMLPADFEQTHVNMNDNSIEGMKHKTLPIASVQFYPESYMDCGFCDGVIDGFLKTVQEVQNA